MRLQLKSGDLVRNEHTGELFVVISQGHSYVDATDTKGKEVKLRTWDLELFDGIGRWITHKDLVLCGETLKPTWR